MGVEQGSLENMVMDLDFWKEKNVFITGHTGFKGSWLCLLLQNAGASLVGYSLEPPTNPSLFEKAEIARGMKSITGNVCDLEKLSSALKEHSPEIVIHMAAQSLVVSSYSQPVETYATNVMGTVHTLEAVRNCSSVKALLIVTSDKCYENKEWDWGYRENEPVGGLDPYSNSKGCAELVTSAYRHSFFKQESPQSNTVGVATVRAGNVIGGGDWAKDRLIPDMMNNFLNKRPAVIRNPNSVRPWQFVLDPIEGYLTLAERLWEQPSKFSEAWNFGPHWEDAKPVSWIADRLTGLWDNESSWKTENSYYPHESKCLRLDCSKANTDLGWTSKLRLHTTLEWIVEWYNVFAGGGSVRKITEEQISRFQNLK